MNNSGSTTGVGITFPLAEVDEFAPAEQWRQTAESVEDVLVEQNNRITAHLTQATTALNSFIASANSQVAAAVSRAPAVIRAANEAEARTLSAANPTNFYWVA